jgi:hypothetical protein
MEYFEKIVNVETGEETIREYSAKEIKAVEAAEARILAEIAEQEVKESARQAVLAKLGLTAEEAIALLG